MAFVLYCLAVMANQMMGITFSSTAGRVTAFFDLPHGEAFINACYILFTAMYFPATMPAVLMIERCGVRIAVIMLAAITTTGAVLRCLLLVPGCVGWLQHVIFVGSAAILGVGQALAKNMPAKVAHTYFDEKYWGTCTTLGSKSVPIGIGLGYIVPSLCSSVSVIIVFETFLCTSILILCLCVLWEPVSEESPSETIQLLERTDTNLFQSYKNLMGNLTFVRFLVLTRCVTWKCSGI